MFQHLRTLAIASLALFVAACSSEDTPPAQQGSPTDSPAEMTATPAADFDNPFGMAVEQLSDGVYAIVSPARGFPDPQNLGWNSNTAFVVTGDGVLMFDTGSSPRIGEALREMVRSVTDQPVRWIINTHVHGDHWLGNEAFLADQPEKILASDITIALMHEQGYEWISRFNSMTDGAIGDIEPVPARDAVTESGSHHFAGMEAVILRSERAHSPGDLALWLPEQGVLLASDVIYTGRPPATFDSDVLGWIAFLDEMIALEPEVVLPGHGHIADAQAVVQMRDFFQTLWDLVEAGFEAGQMDYEIAEQARTELADYEALYPGVGETLGEAVSHVYMQVEAALF